MKKTKILVPALGLLALSTVASVTGTVAWFTANARVTASFSKFEIEKLTSDLGISITAGAGTLVSGTAITPTIAGGTTGSEKYATLTHASVNSTNGDVWSKDATNTTIKVDHSETNIFDNFVSDRDELVAKWSEDGETALTYYAISWDCEFSYKVNNSSDLVNLYFDVSSTIIPDTSAATGNIRTYKGFRLGMYTMSADATAATHTVVWSPEQAYSPMTWNNNAQPSKTELQGKTSCYVSSATATTNYTDGKTGNLIYKGDETVKTIDSKDQGEVARKDCLGQFSSSVNKINVKFIAWYEGEDVNVIDGGALDNISADLGFYIRVNKAA